MDAPRFDALTRALSTGSRRGLLGVLLALPGLGGWLALLDADEVDAKGRRKRRRRRRKRRRRRAQNRRKKRNKNKKRCEPKSRTRICAGTCGIVKNMQTCQQRVNCGACACDPPCAACFTCQAGSNAPGSCVPDPAQVGEACGNPGQICQTDGSCACEVASCGGTTPFCAGGACAACSAAQSCSTGCCAGDGSCQPGTEDDACGVVGETCQRCEGELVCQAGACVCAGCFDASEQCQTGTSPQACGVDGGICQTCRAGQLCVDGACMLCLVGSCDPEDTGSCQYATLQEAIDAASDGNTIRLCAETYQEPETIVIDKPLTLLGAGQGENGTVLDGQNQRRVVRVHVDVPDVFLQDLRITGGRHLTNQGGGLFNAGDLTLTDCTVSGSKARDGGGIGNVNRKLTLIGCTVSGNKVNVLGGGIQNRGGEVMLTDCSVTGNTARAEGGGIYNSFVGTITLTNSSVSGNTALGQRGGGGIYNNTGSIATLSADCTMHDNQPNNCAGPGTYNDPAEVCNS